MKLVGGSWQLFVFCHLLAWNRSESIPKDGYADLSALYHSSTTLSPNFDNINKTGLNFAEGSDHNSNKLEVHTATSELNTTDNEAVLLAESQGSTGTSSVKARKGVHRVNIVARKGAPPCLQDASSDGLGSCPPASASTASDKETSPPPVYEPSVSDTARTDGVSEKTVSLNTSTLHPSPHSNGSTGVPQSAKGSSGEQVARKPSVTVVPGDSDELVKTLRSERNVIIPVVALVCAPMLVLLMLFVYKRIEEARGNSDYTRMSFLIEDIYND